METNSYKHNWGNYNLSDIINGVDDNGVRLLKLFLIDYSSVFSEVVNAGCTKCINGYLQKYKSNIIQMENTSQYILKKKYEGISLNDHSSVMVNNRNITDTYAKELLKRFSPETIFDKYPKEIESKITQEVVDLKEIEVENDQPQQIKKNKKNRR